MSRDEQPFHNVRCLVCRLRFKSRELTDANEIVGHRVLGYEGQLPLASTPIVELLVVKSLCHIAFRILVRRVAIDNGVGPDFPIIVGPIHEEDALGMLEFGYCYELLHPFKFDETVAFRE